MERFCGHSVVEVRFKNENFAPGNVYNSPDSSNGRSEGACLFFSDCPNDTSTGKHGKMCRLEGLAGGSGWSNLWLVSISHAIWYEPLFLLHRIEQPHMPLNDQLFTALGQCSSLQRLCLIVKHSTFLPKSVVTLMQSVRANLSSQQM